MSDFAAAASASVRGGAAFALPQVPHPGPAGGGTENTLAAGVIELLLPLRGATFVSDAWRLWSLLGDRACGERWLALLKLHLAPLAVDLVRERVDAPAQRR